MGKIILYIGNKSFASDIEKVKIYANKSFKVVDVLPTTEILPSFDSYSRNIFWLNPLGYFTVILEEDSLTGGDKYEILKETLTGFNNYISPYLPILAATTKAMRGGKTGVKPLTSLSFIYIFSSDMALVFIMDDIDSPEDYMNRSDKMGALVFEIFEGNQTLIKRINEGFKVDKKTTFLLFDSQKDDWEITDLLFKVGGEKMIAVKERKVDSRFSKPDMMVSSENLNREITLPNNWQIVNKTTGFVMDKPNDIAMYRSIANKSISRAKEIWKTLKDCNPHGLILSDKKTGNFFDYFEEVIQAFITSYTTIECMANICIPYGFVHSYQKKGLTVTLTKVEIEQKTPLAEKLKIIIPAALNIPSPVNEKWWHKFKELEDIRNEIIHTKKSTAENRYSIYISEDVFQILEIHNTVVEHYAKQLCILKNGLLNECPIDSGCDAIIPSITSQKSFDSFKRRLHNIPDEEEKA